MGGWKGDAQKCTSQQVAPIRELPALSSSTCPGMILPLSEETGISGEELWGSPEALLWKSKSHTSLVNHRLNPDEAG